MKHLILFLILILPVFALANGNTTKKTMGGKATLTDVKMEDVSGAEISLADLIY